MDTNTIAVVVGANGGRLSSRRCVGRSLCRHVIGLSRSSKPRLDIEDEATIERAAQILAERGTPTVIINAIGLLHAPNISPEKSWKDLNGATLSRLFAINSIGPALLMKHFLPLLPKRGPCLFVTLSAKVGSIGDNTLGGWYGYRASKAALNQFVRTASIELARANQEAICVAIHPGTVDTALSKPFAKAGCMCKRRKKRPPRSWRQ